MADVDKLVCTFPSCVQSELCGKLERCAWGAEAARPVFSQSAYNQITGNLDSIMTYMMTEFGKSEAEAQAWLQEFVTGHYFPVWRRMSKKG